MNPLTRNRIERALRDADKQISERVSIIKTDLHELLAALDDTDDAYNRGYEAGKAASDE